MVQSELKINIKRLTKNAIIPKYHREGDAGMDLVALSTSVDEHGNRVYYTGLSVEIPEGYVGLLFPRSSISKYDLHQANSVGVIDSGYRGEIVVKFKSTSQFPVVYNIGDRVAQLIIIPHPKVTFVEAEELGNSQRGSGSFGSTGN